MNYQKDNDLPLNLEDLMKKAPKGVRGKLNELKYDVLSDEKAGYVKRMQARMAKSKAKLTREEEDRRIRDAAEENEDGIIEGSLYAIPVVGPILEKIAKLFGGDKLPDLDKDSIAEEIKDDLEKEKEDFRKKKGHEFVIAHRGDPEHENSPKGIKNALDKKEKQIELDVRVGPPPKKDLYVTHDPFDSLKELGSKPFTFAECLELIATHEYQNTAIYFEIKEPEALDKFDDMINTIDKKYIGKKKGYRPIAKRHYVASFSSDAIKTAYKKRKDRPLLYFYVPTDRFMGMQTAIKFLGRKRAASIASVANIFTGMDMSKEIDRTKITMNGKLLDDKAKDPKTFVDMWDKLPQDKELMTALTESGGSFGISSLAASKEIIDEAHSKGIDVAVTGIDGKTEVLEAFEELGADMVISDTPEALGENPESRHNT